MISVVVYGRNDSHGFNLHKRVCLCLNSIAAALPEYSGVEIIFVDCFSNPTLPPLLYSLYDLLSPRARQLTSVVQIHPSLHGLIAPEVSYLHLSEPIIRNLGIKYCTNHWILNTTTDILFYPTPDFFNRLSTSSADYIALPRYELPEFIWDSLDRTRLPSIDTISEFQKDLSLNTIVLSRAHNIYDAPGDFQLVRKDVLNTIGGYDETMNKGWHVDSNLCKRISLLGATFTSEFTSYAQIFHMNHNRTTTSQVSSPKNSNSLNKYVHSLKHTDWRVERKVSETASDRLFKATSKEPLASLYNRITYTKRSRPKRQTTSQGDFLAPQSHPLNGYFNSTVEAGILNALTPLPPSSRVCLFTLNPDLIDLVTDLTKDHHLELCINPTRCITQQQSLIFDFRPPSTYPPHLSQRHHLRIVRPIIKAFTRAIFTATFKQGTLLTFIGLDGTFLDRLISPVFGAAPNLYFLRVKTVSLQSSISPKFFGLSSLNIFALISTIITTFIHIASFKYKAQNKERNSSTSKSNVLLSSSILYSLIARCLLINPKPNIEHLLITIHILTYL